MYLAKGVFTCQSRHQQETSSTAFLPFEQILQFTVAEYGQVLNAQSNQGWCNVGKTYIMFLWHSRLRQWLRIERLKTEKITL